jgi:hypothetical protein
MMRLSNGSMQKNLDSLVARKIKEAVIKADSLKLSKDTLTKKSGVAIKKREECRKKNRDTTIKLSTLQV